MNVAISSIATDLGTDVSGVQTAITAFTLTMAALMIPGSKLTDIWGRKLCFRLRPAGVWRRRPVCGILTRTTRIGVAGIGFLRGTRGFDALLVGIYERKNLIFVAKVKNGFVPRIRNDFFPALKALRTVQCPSKTYPRKALPVGDR